MSAVREIAAWTIELEATLSSLIMCFTARFATGVPIIRLRIHPAESYRSHSAVQWYVSIRGRSTHGKNTVSARGCHISVAAKFKSA